MVVDTSAIVAILFGEPEAEAFAEAIELDAVRLDVGRLRARGDDRDRERAGRSGARKLDLLLYQAGIRVVPFSPDHLAAARHAFRVFGKGRHAAALTFGDSFSYALRRSTGEPLLFTGEGLARTDLSRCPLL